MVGLLLSLTSTACTPGWPFPSISTRTDGLGSSPIGLVLDRHWMESDASITRSVRRRIDDERVATGEAPSLAMLERLGAPCDASTSTCTYRGSLKTKPHNGVVMTFGTSAIKTTYRVAIHLVDGEPAVTCEHLVEPISDADFRADD